jgi:hypothetical protein
MTLTAGLGLSCLHHGKTVSGMTTVTTAPAAVHVDPSHTDIGPCCRIYFPDEFKGIGMFAFTVLHGFIRMAPGTVFGSDNCRNRNHVFSLPVLRVIGFIFLVVGLTHIRVMGFSRMTIVAGNIGTGMTA